MKPWIAPALTLCLFAGAAGLVAMENTTSSKPDAPESQPDPAPETAPEETEAAEEPEGGEPDAAEIEEKAPLAAGADVNFDIMPDGSAVPELDKKAPKRVRLGVVLFRFEGAEGSGSGARSKAAALELAQKTLAEGTEDFAALVKKGDPGSNKDVGWIRRQVLELRVEYEVFQLAKGEVRSEPLETPRGYWIVRRIK